MPILLLGEQSNHPDIGHQIGLLQLVREQELTVVAALHDLNRAAMFCGRIAVMQGGRLVALGTPAAASSVTADPIRGCPNSSWSQRRDEKGFHDGRA